MIRPLKLLFTLLFLTLPGLTARATDSTQKPADQTWTLMEPQPVPANPNPTFIWGPQATPTEKHPCVFYLKPKNPAKLAEIVQQVSDPQSPSYGKYLTKAQIDELTIDKEGTAAVLKYLHDHQAIILEQTASSIKAEAPISTWQSALHTVFYRVTDSNAPPEHLLRAHPNSLPTALAPFVNFVGNTIQMPVKISHGPLRPTPVPTPATSP